MVDNLPTKETTDVQSTVHTPPGGGGAATEDHSTARACGMSHKGLKGLVLMVACCAAPLVLLLALPVLGFSSGGIVSSMITVLAVLACPVGMVLMMRMMMR